MRYYWLLLGVLVVWRLTHLLVAEDGPWNLIVRLRRRAGEGFWGELLDCFYCLSLWVAAPLAVFLGQDWPERLLLWPALSGGAILMERVTRRDELAVPPALYVEGGEEDHHGLLRRQEETNGDEARSGVANQETGAELATGAAVPEDSSASRFPVRR